MYWSIYINLTLLRNSFVFRRNKITFYNSFWQLYQCGAQFRIATHCATASAREKEIAKDIKQFAKHKTETWKKNFRFQCQAQKRQRRQKQNECSDNPNFCTQRGCAGGRYIKTAPKHTQTCLACTGTNLDTFVCLRLVERDSEPH